MNALFGPKLPAMAASLHVEHEGGIDLVVQSFLLDEGLGEPYRLQVHALALDLDLGAYALVGSDAVLWFGREGAPGRSVYGIVTAISDRGIDKTGERRVVELVIEPALALLRYRTNTRIFAHRRVPEILEEVLAPTLTALRRPLPRFSLTESYEPRDLCIQYDETDLDFAHRLMSEEGICYRFEEQDDKELLVLCDSLAHYTIDHEAIELGTKTEHEGLLFLHHNFRHIPSGFVVQGFNWRIPNALDVAVRGHANALPEFAEVFEHDPQHVVTDTADNAPHVAKGQTQSDVRANLRMARYRVESTSFYGAGNVSTLGAGSMFEVCSEDGYHDGRRLTAFRVVHQADFPTKHSNGSASYHCSLWATPVPYVRPLPIQRRVSGSQSAIVVGPPGEEIHCDEFGRVMVRFHWERQAQPGTTDGWWVRVKQTWAGNGFGALFLPRVGMEVIVEFLGGNPDDPVITGALYNGQNLPPHVLPQHKTVCALRSQSSPGGDGFNELRFEDAAGAEELFLQAQKTMTEKVKGSRSSSVGGSRSASVGGSDSTTVSGSQTVTVKKDRNKTVEGNEDRTIVGSRTARVEVDDTTTVVGKRTAMVTGGDECVVTGDAKVHVESKYELEVIGSHAVTVTGPSTFVSTETHDATVMARYAIAQAKIGKFVMEAGSASCWAATSVLLSAGPDGAPTAAVSLAADGTVVIEAKSELVLRCGGSTLVLAADGTVTVSGQQKVDLQGGGGASALVLSATATEVSAPTIKAAAQGDHVITGAKVKIN